MRAHCLAAGLEYWLDVHDPVLRLATAALPPGPLVTCHRRGFVSLRKKLARKGVAFRMSIYTRSFSHVGRPSLDTLEAFCLGDVLFFRRLQLAPGFISSPGNSVQLLFEILRLALEKSHVG
jgi:hypothetical protein